MPSLRTTVVEAGYQYVAPEDVEGLESEDNNTSVSGNGEEGNDPGEVCGEGEEMYLDDLRVPLTPEEFFLALPSSLTAEDRDRVGWKEAGEKEARLRDGLIGDSLKELRLLLGEKLMRYKDLRVEDSQRAKLRSNDGLRKHEEKIQAVVGRYRMHVQALTNLGVSHNWKSIEKGDLNVTGAAEKLDKLAWFWVSEDVSIDRNAGGSVLLERCEYLCRFGEPSLK